MGLNVPTKHVTLGGLFRRPESRRARSTMFPRSVVGNVCAKFFATRADLECAVPCPMAGNVLREARYVSRSCSREPSWPLKEKEGPLVWEALCRDDVSGKRIDQTPALSDHFISVPGLLFAPVRKKRKELFICSPPWKTKRRRPWD